MTLKTTMAVAGGDVEADPSSTVYVQLWEFSVSPENEAAFQQTYGSRGAWAQLFSQAEGYLGTKLLAERDPPGRYVTLDRWRSKGAYQSFKARFAAEYTRLDLECERLTTREVNLGSFWETDAPIHP